MKIPEECSLLCAKDDDILNYLLGGVTAVSYPVRRMGEEAVTHLLKMIIEKQESEIVRGFESMMQERNTVRDISRKGTFGKIAVVGSMNMDSIIEGVLIPLAGETVIAKNLLILPGGERCKSGSWSWKTWWGSLYDRQTWQRCGRENYL